MQNATLQMQRLLYTDSRGAVLVQELNDPLHLSPYRHLEQVY